ncbi:glycosyltransferase family 4 protein [Eilatimonas milleporae]|uniref:Glycosyltransferase involved in cell wall biosynthesis n=1 Tax=Eilatimonas milleporae TaxID=911205 RepID=A0A3M0CSB3_9PROT|nr:glycosyltransferase family 1 protein [Eilatimonas milleporae]RMB12481.1 glycosyltransferase involved in cell wall biosynthesis [Eilatimonas milleporae]
MRICIVTDAWHPQVNGVVRTLDTLRGELKRSGHKVLVLSPKMFRTLPCPTYPEIRLSVNTPFRLSAILRRWQPDAIHIATEGPLGWAARRYCRKNGLAFTTAYHTAFPEYIAARSRLPARWFYPIFRRFHAASEGVLVATPTVRDQLSDKGFERIVPWTRGVDTRLFHPRPDARFDLTGPIQLYVGRVAVEKNIEDFLKARVPGTKVVVGDGPALSSLRQKYPDVRFLGALFGEDLAQAYAAADVFVFPSKTDTFGLVMIEALACGTPVAAYPVQGPLDVLGPDGTGPFANWSKPVAALNDDLDTAIRQALTLDRGDCAAFAQNYSWNTVTEQFVTALRPLPVEESHPLPLP